MCLFIERLGGLEPGVLGAAHHIISRRLFAPAPTRHPRTKRLSLPDELVAHCKHELKSGSAGGTHSAASSSSATSRSSLVRPLLSPGAFPSIACDVAGSCQSLSDNYSVASRNPLAASARIDHAPADRSPAAARRCSGRPRTSSQTDCIPASRTHTSHTASATPSLTSFPMVGSSTFTSSGHVHLHPPRQQRLVSCLDALHQEGRGLVLRIVTGLRGCPHRTRPCSAPPPSSASAQGQSGFSGLRKAQGRGG